jgi:CHAT domain-containing protein
MRIVVLLMALSAALAAPGGASASPWDRFQGVGDAFAQSVRDARADYENAWNALLVAELRAHRARADSATALAALERRLADAEPAALGSRLAADALALQRRWSAHERDTRIDAAVAESLAAEARTRRDWAAAESLYRNALSGYRRLAEKRREAWVLGSLGAVALGADRPERAREVLVEALAARRALGDPRLIGNTLNDLGQTCLRLERSEEARRWLAEAVDVRARSGQAAGEGASLGFLGLALMAGGERDSAERCFERSLVLTSLAGDSARTLLTLVNYASGLSDPSRSARAAALLDRARTIAGQRGDTERLSLIEDNLGDDLRQQGRYTEALAHEREAERLRADDPPRLATTLAGIGLTLADMGDPDRGIEPLRRSLALADSLGSDELGARALVNLAYTEDVAGDLAEARRSADRALARAVAGGDSALVRDAAHTRGQIELHAGAPAEAGRWIDRALAAGADAGPERRARMVVNRALAWHLEGRLDEAERAYGEAMTLARPLGASDIEARILTNRGDVAERRRDYPAAFARYSEALGLIDSIRARQGAEHDAVKALANRVFVHEAMIHLLGKIDAAAPDSHYAARAFAWAERARARALLDLVAAAGGGAGAPIDIDEARARLTSDGEALLEYSVGDSSTSLWVVRRSGWRYYRLPARGALRLRVLQLRQALAAPGPGRSGRALEAARSLERILIEPVEPMLKGVDRLVISPDGPLALVPFEALLARDPLGDAAPTGAFLVERFAIRYTPSASSLLPRPARPASGGVVAVGHPRFAPTGESEVAAPGRPAPLPETAPELESLTRDAGARPLIVLEGERASAGRLLALPQLREAAVIHFATHADVDEAEPERSGLWLAPDSGEVAPSRLEAGTVAGLRLAADLVTLSACETGLGRLERGEGVLGLQRSFLAAGAHSVVASLWKVDDRSTALMMEAFYRRALVQHEDRVVALEGAKRELIARAATRSPFYWAPFVLWGEAGAIAPVRSRPVKG